MLAKSILIESKLQGLMAELNYKSTEELKVDKKLIKKYVILVAVFI